MKKITWIIPVSVVLFDYLFYKHNLGVNLLTFNLQLIGLSLWLKPNLINSSRWKLIGLLALATSISNTMFGDILSQAANFVTLLIFATTLADSNTSFGGAMLGSAWTFVSSPFTLFFNTISALENRKNSQGKSTIAKIITTAVILGVVLLFFFVYRGASIVFSNYTSNINLDFISIPWIFFTFFGFFLLFSFFNYKHFTPVRELIDLAPSKIKSDILDESLLARLHIEAYAGKLLLILLNALLLLVNSLDFGYFIRSELPKGITYSSYVHQGVGMLILSIVLAIAILLFIFRGQLNFYKENKLLKALAFGWVVQNILMIVSTICRNSMYIDAYGLTEKRIGVYIYLLMAIVGLFTTLLKIRRDYSNAHLFRINSWAFYGILIASCFVSWDNLITRFNLSRKDVDENFTYLNSLSETNIPLLVNFIKNYEQLHPNDTGLINQNAYQLHNRIYDLLSERDRPKDWQAWTFNHQSIGNYLTKVDLKTIHIQYTNQINFEIIKKMGNLQAVKIIDSYEMINFKTITSLGNLKKLELINCNLHNVEPIGQLQNLEYIDLSNNPIEDYTFLYELPRLKTMVVSKDVLRNLKEIATDLPQISFKTNDKPTSAGLPQKTK